MFSRAWVAVLAGSVALWTMNELGGGAPLLDGAGGSDRPSSRVRAWSSAASSALEDLAACLDRAAAAGRGVGAADVVDGVSLVERWYRERCRPGVDGAAFDAFAVSYGERSRAAVFAILNREERLAEEVVAGLQAAVLDPGVVWEAALARAAVDVRSLHGELVAWFEVRAPTGGAVEPGSALAEAGAPLADRAVVGCRGTGC